MIMWPFAKKMVASLINRDLVHPLPEHAARGTPQAAKEPDMATAAPAVATVATSTNTSAQPNKFISFLEKAGKSVRSFLHIGIEAAKDAEPIVDVAIPQVASLYNTVVGLCVSAEATAVSATGSGPQKLADVVSKVGPEVEAYFSGDKDKIQAYVTAVVQTLNLIPAKA